MDDEKPIEKNTVEDRVLLVLENQVISSYEITNTSTFEDMGLDSLDKIEVMMDVEDEFPGLAIPDEHISLIDTFGELIEYVKRLTGEE